MIPLNPAQQPEYDAGAAAGKTANCKHVRAALHDRNPAAALGQELGERKNPVGFRLLDAAAAVDDRRDDLAVIHAALYLDIVRGIGVLDGVRQRLADGEQERLRIALGYPVPLGELLDLAPNGRNVACVGRKAEPQGMVACFAFNRFVSLHGN